jgi:hypothetical protein
LFEPAKGQIAGAHALCAPAVIGREIIMSGSNGDKARHDRERKKKVLRKKRTRDLRKKLSSEIKGTQVATHGANS